MTKKFIFTLLLTQLMALTSTQAYASHQIPPDLMFNGKPIDSLCFFNMESKTNTIDLNDCGVKKNNYHIESIDARLTQKGYIGYNWRDSSISPGPQGYSYYRYFDAGNKKYWIYTINNGGGSGDFTAVHLVQRTSSNTIEIKNVTGGDRCNGGVQDVSDKNGKLLFSVNLTAYDFIALARSKLPNIKAYDDLAACAVCCVASAFYSIDTHLNSTLTSVDLGKDTKIAEMPEQGKYQACFNKLYISYINKGMIIFNQQKLNAFATRFSQTCI